MQNIITIEPPPAIYACSDSIYLFIARLCYIASMFHVLTRGLQRIMLQTFQTTSKGAIGRCHALSYAVGVDGLTLSLKPSVVIVFRWP